MSKSQRIDIPLVGGKNDDIPEELLPPGQFVTADGGYFTQQGELRRFNETVTGSQTGVLSDGSYLYPVSSYQTYEQTVQANFSYPIGETEAAISISSLASAAAYSRPPVYKRSGSLELVARTTLLNTTDYVLWDYTTKDIKVSGQLTSQLVLSAGTVTVSSVLYYVLLTCDSSTNNLKITAIHGTTYAVTTSTTAVAITAATCVNNKIYGFNTNVQKRFTPLTGAVEQTGAIATNPIQVTFGQIFDTTSVACIILGADGAGDTYAQVIHDSGAAFSDSTFGQIALNTTALTVLGMTAGLFSSSQVVAGGALFTCVVQTRYTDGTLNTTGLYFDSAVLGQGQDIAPIGTHLPPLLAVDTDVGENYTGTGPFHLAYKFTTAGSDVKLYECRGLSTILTSGAAVAGTSTPYTAQWLISNVSPGYGSGVLPSSTTSYAATTTVSFPVLAPAYRFIDLSGTEFPVSFGVTTVNLLKYPAHTLQFANTTYLSGNLLRLLEAGDIKEANFFATPQGFSLAESNTASGALTLLGVYKYKLAYKKLHRNGLIEYSGPSQSVTITLTGANDTVTVTLPSDLLTLEANTFVDIYRTEAGGSVYYYNGTVLDTGATTYVDTLSDANLIAQAPLYTETGELDNILSSPADSLAVFDNRLWLLNSGEGLLTYSQEPQVGKMLTFSDTFVIDCNKDAGQPYVLAGLEQMLLIGCANGILRLYGSGPSLDGQGGSYSVPAKFIGGIQCIQGSPAYSHGSWAIFDTSSGLVKVTTDGQVEYIGKAIRETTGARPLVDIFAEPDRDVIWCLINGVFYLYNYRLNVWTTLTLSDTVVRAGLHNNQLVYQYSNSGGGYKTGANSTYLTLKTGWLNLNGIEGFYRLKRIYVKVDDQSAGNANKYAHVYTQAPGFSQEDYNVNETTLLQPYFRVHPLHQKADRIQLQVKVGVTSGTAEGYRLQGLSLEWAPKPKLPR